MQVAPKPYPLPPVPCTRVCPFSILQHHVLSGSNDASCVAIKSSGTLLACTGLKLPSGLHHTQNYKNKCIASSGASLLKGDRGGSGKSCLEPGIVLGTRMRNMQQQMRRISWAASLYLLLPVDNKHCYLQYFIK